MSSERRSSTARSGADENVAELRAREALVASMVAELRQLLWISPFEPSRLVPWSQRLCELQQQRATEEFGADSQEGIRASVLAALAHKWEESEAYGWWDEGERAPAHIKRAIARLSGLDVPLALLRPDLAKVEEEIAQSLLYALYDEEVESAVDQARSLLDHGIPAVSEGDFAAWEAAVWLLAEWIDDITSRASQLIDAQIAMVEVLRAMTSSSPVIHAEMVEIEMYIDEVRSSVPGPEGSQPLEERQRHILTRHRADSAFDAVGPLRALLVQASAVSMTDEERITFVWGVERDIADLYCDSGDLAKALELTDRSLRRLLEYQRSGLYDFPGLYGLVLLEMDVHVTLTEQLGDFGGLVRAVRERFDWIHQVPDFLSNGLSQRNGVVNQTLMFIESPLEQVLGLQVFQELTDAVYSTYPEDHPDYFDDELSEESPTSS